MDQISNLVGLTGIPAFMYYASIILLAVFFAGFYLKSKLAKLCQENNKDIEDRMIKLEQRLDKHETETLKVSEYEKDMSNVSRMFTEIKQDVRDGFDAVNKRIDALIMNFSKSTS